MILFSSNGNQISIQSDSIIGQRTYSSTQLVKYYLDKGLFAGGRFVVWIYGQSLESELTINGSGVPIIISERGTLFKNEKH